MEKFVECFIKFENSQSEGTIDEEINEKLFTKRDKQKYFT